MFWDKAAYVYDIFAYIINREANRKLCEAVGAAVSFADDVLECACGTGLLTGDIAEKCKSLVATDFSPNMIKKAEKKCRKYANVEFKVGNILHIEYPDESFDAVVAANVIHLLDDPYKALSELDRVCRKGGKIIIPTYMNKNGKGKTSSFSDTLEKAGVDFKRAFTLDSYKKFFENAGYGDVSYILCHGRVPCAIAIIRKGMLKNSGTQEKK